MLDFLILSDSNASDGEMRGVQFKFGKRMPLFFFFLPYLQPIIISIETERCVILPSFNMTHDFSLTAHAFNDTQLGAMLSLL